jgi:transposase InsO family protein
VYPRPYKATTVQAKTNPLGLVDLVDRAFVADGPDEIWYGDITYIHTITGWVYLATVIDGFSRKVVGWSVAKNMRTELVTDALTMAIRNRRPEPGSVVFHSDRGSQYQCHLVKPVCADERVSWSPVDVLRSEFGPQEAALASRTCSGR